jgi:glycosyltransferase involved in cell wall biosynthesis
MRLSIIIPAYKVADYIEKCIRSLEHQDIPKEDYEIIVTNDGSPDDCQAIVESLQKEFSNIVLINQENQGVSMARNNAIAIAKGKYVMPIDPDDYVLPNTLAKEIEYADFHNLDVLYLGFEVLDEYGLSTWKTNYSNLQQNFYDGAEGYFAHRGFDVKDPDRSCAILFRRELLNKFAIEYPKNTPYLEDGLFLAKVFAVADKVSFNNAIVYQRTTRIGSATNSRLFYSENAILGFISAIEDFKNFGKLNKLKNEYLLNHVIAKFVILALSPSINKIDFKMYFKTINILKGSGLNKINIQGLRFDYHKHANIFNFSKIIFLFYYKLFSR